MNNNENNGLNTNNNINTYGQGVSQNFDGNMNNQYSNLDGNVNQNNYYNNGTGNNMYNQNINNIPLNNEPVKKFPFKFVIIAAIVVVGIVSFIVYKNSNLKNENKENKTDVVSSEKKDNIYDSNKVKLDYTTLVEDLSDSDKKKIIDNSNGSCKLVDSLDLNMTLDDDYYNFDDPRDYIKLSLHLGKIMKFECGENLKDRIVLEQYIYGNNGSYLGYQNRIIITNAKDEAIDIKSITRQSGYDNVGSFDGLPFEYRTFNYNISLGTQRYIQNSLVPTFFDNLMSGYWYYNVDDASTIDLNDLYVFYISGNKDENKDKLSNYENSPLYKKVKLTQKNDSIPSDAKLKWIDDRNETKIANEKVIYSSYKIEKWEDKNVLILPYEVKFIDSLAKKFFYKEYLCLMDKDGKCYYHLGDKLNHLTLKEDVSLESVFILPDNYDVDKLYLAFFNHGLAGGIDSRDVVPLNTLEKTN